MHRHSSEDRLEGLLRARVQHFVAHIGRVWIPRDEHQLGGGPAIVRRELAIDQPVTAIVVGKGRTKVCVRFGPLAFDVNDDFRLVLDFVHIEAELFSLVKLEGSERRCDFVFHYDTGRLRKANGRNKDGAELGMTKQYEHTIRRSPVFGKGEVDRIQGDVAATHSTVGHSRNDQQAASRISGNRHAWPPLENMSPASVRRLTISE